MIDNLPNTVGNIDLGDYFILPLTNIPSSVKKILIDNKKYKCGHSIQYKDIYKDWLVCKKILRVVKIIYLI